MKEASFMLDFSKIDLGDLMKLKTIHQFFGSPLKKIHKLNSLFLP